MEARYRRMYCHILVMASVVLAAVGVSVGRTSAWASGSGALSSAKHRVALIRSPPPSHGTLALPASHGFTAAVERRSPQPVSEVVNDRTALSSTWRDSDGSLSVRRYLAPHFYRSASTWRPINITLASLPGRPTLWRSRTNSWSVTFRPASAAAGTEQIDTKAGQKVAFTPVNPARASEAPVVRGATAKYAGIWPHTDMVETVASNGVAEDLILRSRSAPSSMAFKLTGATARFDGHGGLMLRSHGQIVGSVPPPTISIAAGRAGVPIGSPASLRRSAGLKYAVRGDEIQVTVSHNWLSRLPARAFPIRIDPSYTEDPTASQAIAYSSDGRTTATQAKVGQDSNGLWYGAAYIPFPTPPAAASGQQPWSPAYARLSIKLSTSNCPTSGQTCGLINGWLNGLSSKPQSANDILNGQAIARGIGPAIGFDQDVTNWFSQHRSGAWFGFGGDYVYDIDGSNTPITSTASLASMYVNFTYYQEPNAPTLTGPTNGAVLTSAEPSFTSTEPDQSNICTNVNTGTPPTGVSCDEPFDVTYDFKVSTTPPGGGGEIVADSGWIPQPYTTDASGNVTLSTPSWRVPPGSLTDGVTYYATVQDADSSQNPEVTDAGGGGVTPAMPLPAVMFTVKERLGAGGPSPTDTVGAAPGETSTPAQGAPNPGMSPASVTVNQVTGDLALSIGTPTMSALGGNVGVQLSYNSLQADPTTTANGNGASYGLAASFYPAPIGGPYTFPSTPPVTSRIDPSIDYISSAASPISAEISSHEPFLARWVGYLTLPAGTWQLGGNSYGGMRIYVNGSTTPTYNDWSGSTPGLGFGSTSVTGGQKYQVEVDAWNSNPGAAVIQFAANNVTDSSRPVPTLVPSNWLSPVSSTGLPPGWSVGAGGAVWTQAVDLGREVVLTASTGDTATFTDNNDAAVLANNGTYETYTPPPGDTDSLISTNGHLQLKTSAGQLYTFTSAGTVASVTTVADDRHPAAPQYTYGPASTASGAPLVLQSITDPVSNRSVALSYGSSSSCAQGNSLQLLCQITFWDGTSTKFIYNANGQLAEVVDPASSASGNTTLLGYDASNRLNDIRDALANAYITSGQTSQCTSSQLDGSCPFDTDISYGSGHRVHVVVQPAPTNGAARPSRTYTYSIDATGAGRSSVAIAGFSPPGNDAIAAGQAAQVSFDSQSRITASTNSAGQTSHTYWDSNDRPVVSVDPAGLQTSTVYDSLSDVTDTYGPAPVGCFDSTTVPNGVTLSAPAVGYLPVSDPAGTTGCGTAVPHGHSGYDQNITGLADTYWPNGRALGAAALHGTGAGGTADTACPSGYGMSGSSSTALCGTWASGSVPSEPNGSNPLGTDSDGRWSMTMTGTVTIHSTGDWALCGVTNQNSSGSGLLLTGNVDGSQILTNIDPYVNQIDSSACGDRQLTAGPHTISLFMQGSPAQQTSYGFYTYNPSNGTSAWLPLSDLDPDYGLTTSTTDADGKATTTSYTSANLGPEYGLPTSTTIGAGTADALTTTTNYETPAQGNYLRRTATILPAGNSTTYAYYGGTAGPVAAVCGVNASTPQGGQLQSQTDPAPASGAPAREQQFVYDADGRRVGSRVAPSTSVAAAPWRCTNYDPQGRVTSETWPATSTAPARTVTYSYAVGGNPLQNSVADSSGTITSNLDLLGRMVSYQDANGQTSQITYNQAAQVTADNGPQGDLTNTYDPTSGRLATVTDDSTLMATDHYDSGDGRLTSVTYGNGTTGTFGYDNLGRPNSLTFANTNSGAFVAGDATNESLAGRVTSEQEDISGNGLSNPDPKAPNSTTYTYDGAGRLVSAYLPEGLAAYGYAANPAGDNCPTPNAGQNTNRTSVTITPTSGSPTTTHYCYNNADQLTSTIIGGVTSTKYAYDGHGNQSTDGGTAMSWDSADRLASTTRADTTTSYSFDALDRMIGETTGTSTTRYAYAGFSDSPAAILTPSNAVAEGLVALPGGVTAAVRASGSTWSYPDLHGNYTVVTDGSGSRQGNPTTYDPWGELTASSNPINNVVGSSELGAAGESGKFTDTTTGISIMGARPYNPTEGRFLSVDPIEGGCANAYAFGYGDPIQGPDLNGQGGCSRTDDLKLGAGVLGLVLGGASFGLGFAALAADGSTALSYGLAAVLSGSGAASLDAAGCIRSKAEDVAACTGAALGIIGTLVGVPGAVTAPAKNSGLDAALKALGGVASNLGLASFVSDATVSVGGIACDIGGWLSSWENGLNEVLR